MAVVTIDYHPRHWAESFHNTTKRWIFLLLHRRAGKSTGILNHLQRDCIKIKNSLFAYIGPTYKQTKRTAWDIAKGMSRNIPGVEYNESELTVKYPNGSKLFLAGSDNIDSLRGLGLWGVGLDEYPLQSPILFSEVISKCLADHLGYCIFAGTPKGKGHFYKTYQVALKNPEDWELIERTIDQSLEIEEGETIDNLRIALGDDRRLVSQGEMTEDEFNQEWYNSFEAAIKGSFYGDQIALARKEGRIKKLPYDRALNVHTVWDLGVGPALGIGFFQRVAREVHLIDYWEGDGSQGISDGIEAVKKKPYIYGKHFAPHDINAREEMTGQTRLDSAKALGIRFEVVPKVPVSDGIDKAKLMFGRLWIDAEKCEGWIDLISQYRREWDDDKKMFKKTPYHDFTSHASDCLRYAAISEDKMTNELSDAVEKQKQQFSINKSKIVSSTR